VDSKEIATFGCSVRIWWIESFHADKTVIMINGLYRYDRAR